MTLVATTPRTRPVTHAYVVPVVREITPRPAGVATGATW
jgi:hypothetical protein